MAKRLKRALTWMSGVDKIKSTAHMVAERSTFPIARNMLNRLRANIAQTPIEKISEIDLRRSVKAHEFMILALSPIFMYSLFCVARGISALIQFNTITTWVLFGVPALIFTGSQIVISVISRRNFLTKIS